MSNFHIKHKVSPVFGFFQPVDTSLETALREQIKPGQKLSKETALKVLKRIEIKSKIQATLTKPAVLLILTGAITIAGIIATALSSLSIALLILGIAMSTAGSLAFGVALRSAITGRLHDLSQAYANREKAARSHYDQIKQLSQSDLNIIIG